MVKYGIRSEIMKKNLLFIIPLLLLIISIITSILAFNIDKDIDEGYLYIDQPLQETVYSGNYYVIFGNVDEDAYYINLNQTNDFIEVMFYKEDESLLSQYNVYVARIESSQTLDTDLITTVYNGENLQINEITEQLIELDLEAERVYRFTLEEVTNNGTSQDLDMVFYHVNETLLGRKAIYENVAFTTIIFAIISGLTIFSARILRKDQ